MSYSARMMNIATKAEVEGWELGLREVYKTGHRDARHAAAEIANEADTEIEGLKSILAKLEEQHRCPCQLESCSLCGSKTIWAKIRAILQGSNTK